jgi:hypothetical protein
LKLRSWKDCADCFADVQNGLFREHDWRTVVPRPWKYSEQVSKEHPYVLRLSAIRRRRAAKLSRLPAAEYASAPALRRRVTGPPASIPNSRSLGGTG